MVLPVFNWPNWRAEAKPGMRIRNIRTGAICTFVKHSTNRHNGGVVIWDQGSDKPVSWVSIAVDGEPI